MMSNTLLRVTIATVAAAVLVLGSVYALMRGPDFRDQYRDTLKTLQLEQLPREAFGNRELVRQLDALNRERCDQRAVWDLSRTLLQNRYRREAATTLAAFAGVCDAPENFLFESAQIFRLLGDLTAARAAADKLVARNPASDAALLVRGDILNAQHEYAVAYEDFDKIIQRNQSSGRLNGAVYAGAAEARAQQGEPCKAAALLSTWVAYDPARRAHGEARERLDKYRAAGNCPLAEMPAIQSYARRPNEIIRVNATINGRAGVFILDTGASFVSLTAAFARSANISTNPARTVPLQTANGAVSAMLAHADTVALGAMKTRDVEVVVKPTGGYGPGIDGLLGQSYLSRFQVAMHPDRWTIALR